MYAVSGGMYTNADSQALGHKFIRFFPWFRFPFWSHCARLSQVKTQSNLGLVLVKNQMKCCSPEPNLFLGFCALGFAYAKYVDTFVSLVQETENRCCTSYSSHLEPLAN
jgi:hypothetical protein